MRWWTALAKWSGHHRVLADIAVGVVFGLLVEFVAVPLFFSDTTFLRNFGDGLVDKAIRIHERFTDTVSDATPFVFVDMDDETWRRWGYPLVTPRARLARILDTVAASKPLAIVLDIDLAWPDEPPADAPKPQAAAAVTEPAPTLRAFLERDNAAGPPLLLVRGSISRAPTEAGQWPLLRPTPYDAVVRVPGEGGIRTQTRPGYQWVSPLFERDGDGLVRSARLFAFVCDDDAPVALAASQLMAAAIGIDARHAAAPGVHAASDVRAQVVEAIGRMIPDHCGRRPEAREPQRVSEAPEIELSPREDKIRIIYTVPWRSGAAALGPTVKDGDVSRPLVAIRPAHLVEAAAPGEAIDGLQGRIVVIGGSYRDSGDWHNTPIGAMPGALLIINAAHAVGQYGTPREPSLWLRLPLALLITVVVAVLFSVLRPFGASIAASLFLVLLTIPSAFLFKSGVMLDLAVPSFGVFAHKFLIEIVDRVKLIHSRGWRSLLAEHEGK